MGPAVSLSIRNRQRSRRIDLRRLRDIGLAFLTEELGLDSAELGVHLIGARAMAALNWRWLRHEGSTDILTFDERELAGPDEAGDAAGHEPDLYGELFICIDDAVSQAREFGTTAGAELVRYLVHGVLHLRGFDDREADHRRAMKREEDRWVRRLAARFELRTLVGGTPARRGKQPPRPQPSSRPQPARRSSGARRERRTT